MGSVFCVIQNKKLDSIFSTFLYSASALPFIILYAVTTNNLVAIPLKGLIGAGYIGIFATGLAYTSWVKSLHIGDTQKIANLAYLTPFLSLMFISILVKEQIFLLQIIGLVIIIIGILISSKK